jgi:predicted esterase
VTAQTLDFVHRFVAPRPGTPPSDLTLLLLHGTGGDENDLLPLGQAVAPGATLLSPRGRVLEGSAPRFFRRLAEGVLDVPDLIARTHELAAFVAASAARYEFDASRVVALGFSNGANIAASTLLLHPGVLAGAALLRAMVPFEPPAGVALPGTPVYLGAGQFDPLVPAVQTERLASLLRDAGAAVAIDWQPTGHQLAAGEVAKVRDWLSTTFGGR